MLLNEKSMFNDKEIIVRGSRALIRELGYSGFLRFIRQMENTISEDYLNTQEDIYKEMDVEGIFNQAKETWKAKDQKPL